MAETPMACTGAGNSNMSMCVTETVNGSHHFTINGYSLAKGMGVGKYIASECFSVGGYQWAIYFYPDGKNAEDNSLYVSVFIALAREGTDVRALFELTLLDQSGKAKHKVHSHFDRSVESGPYTLKYRGSMWGYKRFFRRAVLETSDFLKNDSLAITCTVGVVVSSTQGPRQYSIPVPEPDLGQHFGALLDSGEGSGVACTGAGNSNTRSRCVTETVNGSHHLTINGYSLVKGMGVGKHIASECFSVGGYQWAIYFYPDGKNAEDDSQYVSVFIALVSEGTDVRALFELALLDQSGKAKHKVHSHFDGSLKNGPYTLKGQGSMWGYKLFFRTSVLETSDFLKNDCLAISCRVGVVGTFTQGLPQYSIPAPEPDLGQHFGALSESGDGTDVRFDVDVYSRL